MEDQYVCALSRQERWRHARRKAEELKPTVQAVGGVWAVSGHERCYAVERNGLSYICDCPAGSHGIPCYHAAAVATLPEEVALRAMARACPGYLRAHCPTAREDGVIEIRYWCVACEPIDDRVEEVVSAAEQANRDAVARHTFEPGTTRIIVPGDPLEGVMR